MTHSVTSKRIKPAELLGALHDNPLPDHGKLVGVKPIRRRQPEREQPQITHYVGDRCLDGHREQAHADPRHLKVPTSAKVIKR